MIIIIFISYSKCKIPQCLQSSEKKLESQLANYACPAQAFSLISILLTCSCIQLPRRALANQASENKIKATHLAGKCTCPG